MKRTIISLVSLVPLTFAACGGDTPSECTATGGGTTSKFVVSALTVPAMKSDYAIDLNGDNRPDNALGQIISTLSLQGLNVQMGVDQAVQSGTLVLLVSETSTDAAFQNDTCASATVQLGKKDASGAFSVDTTQPGGTFTGPIKAGKFSSAAPATTKHPVTVAIKLPLLAGAEPLNLTLYGAHLSSTKDASGNLTGQIQGAIKNSDVQTVIIPSVAKILSDKIAADNTPPNTLSDADHTILGLFDKGGCTNPAYGARAGMAAAADDLIVDTCEVAGNPTIKSVLGPDVQMFDASGNYAPSASNTTKDSLSLGLAFTAGTASF